MAPTRPGLVSLPKQWEVSSKQSQITTGWGRGGKGQAASGGLQQDLEMSFWPCLRHPNLGVGVGGNGA